MKTNKILLGMLAMATLSLASCSSEENEVNLPSEKTAKMEINILGTAAGTRATATDLPTQADENTIARFTVAIFNSDGSINAMKTVKGKEDKTTVELKCTPAENCTGIIVANAPKDDFFDGVPNKDEFLKKVISLTDAQTSKALPMSGEVKTSGNASTFTLLAGTEYKEATAMKAELSRLVARVSISSIKTAFNEKGQFKDATYTLKNIYIRNAVKEVVPSVGGYNKTKMTTPAFLTGSYTNSTNTEPKLATAVNPEVNVTAGEHTSNYWFYVFPNEEAKTHTALVLEGTFKKTKDDAGTTIYYPIIINKNQEGTTITGKDNAEVTKQTGTIARNTRYALTATIKNIGTDDPMGDIDPAAVTLNVTVADWVLDIKQNVTFE